MPNVNTPTTQGSAHRPGECRAGARRSQGDFSGSRRRVVHGPPRGISHGALGLEASLEFRAAPEGPAYHRSILSRVGDRLEVYFFVRSQPQFS